MPSSEPPGSPRAGVGAPGSEPPGSLRFLDRGAGPCTACSCPPGGPPLGVTALPATLSFCRSGQQAPGHLGTQSPFQSPQQPPWDGGLQPASKSTLQGTLPHIKWDTQRSAQCHTHTLTYTHHMDTHSRLPAHHTHRSAQCHTPHTHIHTHHTTHSHLAAHHTHTGAHNATYHTLTYTHTPPTWTHPHHTDSHGPAHLSHTHTHTHTCA